MRVLTTNHAATATLLDTAGAALTGATGFLPAHLLSQTLDSTWKPPAAAVATEFVLDLGSAKAVNCAAVFDVWAVYVTASAAVYHGAAATGPWTLAGTLTHGGRRDWGGAWSPITARYWKIAVQPQALSATQPEIAHVALGLATDLRRGEATREVESVDSVLVNGSQATKTGEETMRFSLRWGTLATLDHAEILSLKRAVGGAKIPFALWPDAGTPGAVYWGRLGVGMRWSENFPVYTGHGWEFTELERTLRG
jgi:hypothetical protein